MKKYLKTFWKNTYGATAIQYGLIAALIPVLCLGAIKALGVSAKCAYQTTYDSIKAGKKTIAASCQTPAPTPSSSGSSE